ncbi:MAG: helix-turn-helix domain-containing protein [Clostridia bacterium]|jgi:hypothetical protein|nr:helix-turn-helix domain-containing protein [Clostridia bacterium]
MNNTENANNGIQEVMNAKDIARYLKISVSQAYNLLASESFPTLHIGNRKLVTINNLNEWMLKNTNTISD